MQTENRVLDGFARVVTNAAGAAQAFRTEIETMIRTRFDRLIADLDLVSREEFDAVKTMVAATRRENEALAARIAALEAGSAQKEAPIRVKMRTGAAKRTASPPKQAASARKL
jgi:BMFP domain-containing protein YqiC